MHCPPAYSEESVTYRLWSLGVFGCVDAPVYQCVNTCILMFASMLHACVHCIVCTCASMCVCVCKCMGKPLAYGCAADMRSPDVHVQTCSVRVCVYMCVCTRVHSKQPMPQLGSLRRAPRMTMQCKAIPVSKNRHDYALAKDIYAFHTT